MGEERYLKELEKYKAIERVAEETLQRLSRLYVTRVEFLLWLDYLKNRSVTWTFPPEGGLECQNTEE